MPRKTYKNIYMYLDKVERKKLAEIKSKEPSYADLELNEIAHLELKNRLFELSKKQNAATRI